MQEIVTPRHGRHTLLREQDRARHSRNVAGWQRTTILKSGQIFGKLEVKNGVTGLTGIFRIAPITAAAALATACAAPGFVNDVVAVPDVDLLSGRVLFGEPVETASIADTALLELDDEMRTFVAELVDGARGGKERMRRLLAAMIESGLMSLDYDDDKTRTARQTFHERVGNCMSFTALFVALAREADLEVRFQTVEVAPVWHADSDLLILNNHVNAVVEHNFGSRVTVDFNATELKGDYKMREVSDEYALALYSNNIAMEALRRGDLLHSFRLLKKSFETYPYIADNWSNLGVVYSRGGEDDHAIAAYMKALDLDSQHRPALVNLASIYRARGDKERADYFARQVRRHQEQNPYYHYFHALAAYNADDLETAEARLVRAIDLEDTDYRFFQLRGLIAIHSGDRRTALESFQKARTLAVYSDAHRVYDNKISLLTGKR